MKILDLRSEAEGKRPRVSAKFVWENTYLPEQEIFFETTAEFSQSLSCNPHAFLLIGLLRAMHHGEERILIDAEVCPALKEGLITAASLMNQWYSPDKKLIKIEAKTAKNPILSTSARAGSFLSGGIDSLTTLRANRLNLPLEHPWSIKDCIFIYGADLGHQHRLSYEENYPKQYDIFQRRTQSLLEVAEDAGITLIPIYTNTQSLSNDLKALEYKYHGADLAAVGHILSKRLTSVSIASTADIQNLHPWGSHPLLDQYYSSSDMRIFHADITLSRLAKTKLVTEWDIGLQNIRVCSGWDEDPNASDLNCGRCEKCLRTMTGLVALKQLGKTSAFVENDVTKDMLWAGANISSEFSESCWQELMTPLDNIGRPDLVDGIHRVINRYHVHPMIKKINRKIKRLKRNAATLMSK